jgi:uncharacterized protein with PIN domain
MRAWEVIRSGDNGSSKPQALGLFATKELAVDWMNGHPQLQTEVVEREFPDEPDPIRCHLCGGSYVKVRESTERAYGVTTTDLWACETCGHPWD